MAGRIPLKDHLRETRLFTSRAVTALVIVAVLMLLVVIRLIYLQIIDHQHFATLSEKNRVNILPIPPNRGLIYDRNGILLAQNLPTFSLELIPEQVKDLNGTIAALADMIAISEEDIQEFHRRLEQARPFEPVPLRFHLSDEEVARFAINRQRFPGVDVQARLVRYYPLGKFASHAIGYVGRINEQEQKELDSSNYRETTHIGKVGVEKYYEDILHGKVGFQDEETNASGRVLRILQRTPPIPGDNLYLTIDVNLQMVAELMLEGKRGAVVAIQPKTGEILVLASIPGYDPNLFINGIGLKDYQALQEDPDQPLFDRVLTGQYPPGSTVKPIMALAGLEFQEITPNSHVFCPGWYSLPGDSHRYRDWRKGGHGLMDVKLAIMHSCDVYFYNLAHNLGIDRMYKYMSYFGFGHKTGVDLPNELSGLMPSPKWKLKTHKQAWYPGETLITGIGQGYTLATPLQLAYATSIIANRGVQMQPHILYARQPSDKGMRLIITPKQTGKIPVSNASNWDTVIEGMMGVIHTPGGTAYGISRGLTYHMAGKSGTAQVFGLKQNERYHAQQINERLRDHALFIAFAPVENPEIAVAVVVENGGGGSETAAPIARAVMDRYFFEHGEP